MKKFDADNWVRPNIRELMPYSSARDEFSGEDYVFLDANENPFDTGLNRYPDPYAGDIRSKIAELKQCLENELFLGNGSDEAIDLLYRCFAEPGNDRVLSIAPSYGMYKVCADINGVGFDTVLLDEDFSLIPDRLLKEVKPETKIIFLCSPNNPSGNVLDAFAVRRILDDFPGLVVIDEAYQDFSSKSSNLNLMDEYQNLVVLQTFSKAWGMAGARLGMAFADSSVISYLNKVKYPYNINQLSQNVVFDALEKPEIVEDQVQKIVSEKERVINILESLPGVNKVFPSEANFVLIKLNEPKQVYQALLEKGIVVRDISSVPLCDGCLRITIGTEKENKMLIDSLSIILKTNTEYRIPNTEN